MWGGALQSQELSLGTLVGPFHVRMSCDPVNLWARKGVCVGGNILLGRLNQFDINKHWKTMRNLSHTG